MNNTLQKLKFNDLLPMSVKDDPKFIAASNCLDKLLSDIDDRMKSMLVYSRIDELPESEIDDLAWQWNIGYFEGYSLAANIDEKRGLVKHAIQAHWYKGTKWALESIPTFLGMPTFIVEWFESDLIGALMSPYEFDVAVDTSSRGASLTIHDDIRILINNLKNVRSYLRHIILLASWNVSIYYGTITTGINFGAIRPKDWSGGTTELKYGRAVGNYHAVSGHVRPKLWVEKEIKLKYSMLVGSYAAITGKVMPKMSVENMAVISNKNAVGGYYATVGRVYPL